MPVLFALAAAFYAKLGYMAFFGCSDGKSVISEFEGKLSNLETELHRERTHEDIDYKFKDLSEKLTALQDKIIDKEKKDKERIDLIKKDTERLQLEGVTAGCLKKGNSNKGMNHDGVKYYVMYFTCTTTFEQCHEKTCRRMFSSR